ncbi:MAG: acyl-CoA dehydrogenase family protein [Cyclobacteriaceae bacterium]|nr:acyl-CoA dehydrogenase family protein [Cyclobacteriaceae bacterium]
MPLLYVLWQDGEINPLERRLVEELMQNQPWMDEKKKESILLLIDNSQAPDLRMLQSWKEEIQKILPKDPGHETLLSLGARLANYHMNQKFPAYDTPELVWQIGLDILGKESIYHFYKGHPTITGKQKTLGSFDIQSMQSILDGHHAGLIEQLKALLENNQFRYKYDGNIDKYREKVLDWSKILASKGYGSLAYPEAYSGKNDMDAYFQVMETLSLHDLSLVIKFGVQFGLWGMSIYFLGTEKHHKKYLENIGSMELPGCFAMTETHHGSNVKGIETTATYHHDSHSFIIHTPHRQARKEYIGNAACHGQMATVFAQLMIDGQCFGVNAFIVPLRNKDGVLHTGVEIEDCGRKMGLNGVDNGLISFNNVEIPKENMLDRFASVDESGRFQSPIASEKRRFFTMLGTLVGGRIGIPRSALSAVKSGLNIAIRYGDKRRQFGPEGGEEVPILNYRMHQRRLMPLLARTYAHHFALRYLTHRFLHRKEEEMQEIEALAAGMKAVVTWHCTQSLQECREACGGKGYLSENRIDALKNDTDVYTTFEGDNVVLMQLVAKSRLSDFKKNFSDITLFTMTGYLADKAMTVLSEKNPFIVRNTQESHLLDPEFHLAAFRYRETDILTSAARRLKRLMEGGLDSFDAMNVCQHHLINVGRAYIDRIVLEQFLEVVEKTPNQECRNVLKKLCQLYALYEIESNATWYLEQGYIDGVKSKAIRKMVNQLCWEIRQDAVPLVDAFGISNVLLNAEIVSS